MSGVTRGYGLLESYLAKKRCEMANRHIPDDARSGRLLDIGCGTYPYFLVNTAFNERVGLDLESDPDNAPENITLIKHDFENASTLPIDDVSVDVVTMLAVFEHIKLDLLIQLLKEIHRVLKPGGRYILTTPSPIGNYVLYWMAKCRLVSADEIDEHEDGYHQKVIMSHLETAGFSKEQMRFGYFEFWMNNWGYAIK